VSQIFISYAKEDVDFARRLSGAVAAFLGLGACSEALDWGDPELHGASAFLLGLAIYLIFLGRKPA